MIAPITAAEIERACGQRWAPEMVAAALDGDALGEVRHLASTAMAAMGPMHACPRVEHELQTVIVTALIAGVGIGMERSAEAVQEAGQAVALARSHVAAQAAETVREVEERLHAAREAEERRP